MNACAHQLRDFELEPAPGLARQSLFAENHIGGNGEADQVEDHHYNDDGLNGSEHIKIYSATANCCAS